MVLTIVVSCCSVSQLYKYKQSGNKVRSTYERWLVFKLALYYNSDHVLGLPIVMLTSALTACSQLLVITTT